MGKIYFTLDKTLKRLEISPYFLATEAKIKPTTIYNMKKNETSRISMETLESLLDTINTIAEEKGINEDFNIEDILIYKK